MACQSAPTHQEQQPLSKLKHICQSAPTHQEQQPFNGTPPLLLADTAFANGQTRTKALPPGGGNKPYSWYSIDHRLFTVRTHVVSLEP